MSLVQEQQQRKKTEMWYAVETAFVNGKHYKSVPCFHKDVDEYSRAFQPGTCMRPHWEQPGNSSQTFLGGLIEIHVDWFQTKQQAEQFINGGITYVITRRNNGHGLPDFVKWEAVPALEYLPYRGVYKDLE